MRRRGFTLLEVLITAAMVAVILGAAWLGYFTFHRWMSRLSSHSAALQATLVILERLSHDVHQMVYAPIHGDMPLRLSPERRAVAFFTLAPDPAVAASPVEDPVAEGTLVAYQLRPRNDGRFVATRNGKPIAGVVVEDWEFRFLEAGPIRKAEIDDWQGLGFGIDALNIGYAPSLLPDDAPLTQDPAADALVEQDRFSLDPADPMAHMGPFLLFRVTVIDDGGARVTRTVLYDLVNAHMMGHHGMCFPFPEWAMRLDRDFPEELPDRLEGPQPAGGPPGEATPLPRVVIQKPRWERGPGDGPPAAGAGGGA